MKQFLIMGVMTMLETIFNLDAVDWLGIATCVGIGFVLLVCFSSNTKGGE